MPTLQHIHTYRKIRGRKKLYKCLDKYCTHVAEKALILGKASKCCKCGEEITLTSELLQLAEPACINCRDTKEGRLKKRMDEIMNNLGVK